MKQKLCKWQKSIFFLMPLFMITCHFTYKKWERISLWLALQCSPPSWAQEQISQDFAPFVVTKISQESLNETFQKVSEQDVHAYRYRIVGGEIFRKPELDHTGRASIYDKILKRMQKSINLPNVDFILCVMDGVPEVYVPSRFWVTENQAPLLCWAKKEDAPSLILIPDCLTIKEAGWHREIATVDEKYRSIPWGKREEKAFWRGNVSDKIYTVDNYSTKPRFLISLLSAQHQDVLDAGFCNGKEGMDKILKRLSLIVGHTSVADHLSYKYLPVLDGWMCTFPGFQWRLLSGSLSMKQESDEVQYFYGALKPFVHYLPIKNDMGDLIEKISWARSHDDECRRIAETARTFAKENLMPNQIYAYLYWVLKEYESLQTFDSFKMDSSWKKVK